MGKVISTLKIGIVMIIAILAVACQAAKEEHYKDENQYYIESSLSFFDPYDSDYTSREWIRDAENIKIAHETFKKIGYHQLIDSAQLYQNPCLLWGYVSRPCNELIDSALLTYKQATIKTKYYRGFWERRKQENNDQVVFQVLKEIKAILMSDSPISHENQLVNDTLFRLILIDRVQVSPSEKQAKNNFNYLKDIGLHKSAYNLLNNTYEYQEIDWEESQLVKQLRTDTVHCCPEAWIKDNTK